ncbi:MAG: hypothetical protein ABUT39_09285 [Acidobacteriota bacterium]
MGAILKKFDESDNLTNEAKELVSTLAALSESKAAHFVDSISRDLLEAGTAGNWTVPITMVLKTTKHTHAYTSEDSSRIGDTVNGALRSFVTGTKDSVLNGVGSLVSEAVTIFLGNASADTGEMREYYVMTEGLSIVRVDVAGWYLNVKAQALTAKMQKVSAFVAFKSAVDLTRLDFNTFLNLYQTQLTAPVGGLTDDIIAELDNVDKIFERFKGLERGEGEMVPKLSPASSRSAVSRNTAAKRRAAALA